MDHARQTRRRTATSSFGSGRREGHDASAFYARFPPPELSSDDRVKVAEGFDEPRPIHGDSREMAALPDNCVALVVTSPPYFVGKVYEQAVAGRQVPESYVEYLALLSGVFRECVRVLEPGGRMAINVANLGRKPYRSLSADVIGILQDQLGLLLRGEIIWRKAKAAGGSCAWGSWRSPANPVLRDVTERIIVAGKGRFNRARTAAQRRADEMPYESTIGRDEFMEATIDIWDIPPAHASRIGHPAPFPVELPARLIQLYTYERDLVLDPFMGSGTTLVAAKAANRRAVGYDIDPDYVKLARARIANLDDSGGTSQEIGLAGQRP